VTAVALPVKQRTVPGFGKRLGEIREQRGLTQLELGEAVGVSNRVIAYYEADGAQPPGTLLTKLADALKVSTDALLGREPIKAGTSPGTARLLKRLLRVEELSPADQGTVLKTLDLLPTPGSDRAAGESREYHPMSDAAGSNGSAYRFPDCYAPARGRE
jgi:transcriptional regulator with XRE-family HTH domain